MTQWYVFETLTGEVLREIEVVSGSWTSRLNEPEALDVTLALAAEDIGDGWKNLLTPWKHSLMVEESGRLYGGPIQPHDYSPGTPLKITASGIRSYFKKRTVLPPEARTIPLVTQEGDPNDALDTTLVGYDLGTIGRLLVAQACSWPGAGLPIVYEPVRAGTRERTYRAVELKNVDEALDQLSGVENGPDFDFRLRWKDDSHVEWALVSGTEKHPQLSADQVFVWDLSAAESAGTDLTVQVNPSAMGSLSWSSAGRGDDSVIIAQAYDPLLVDRGMPLMELVDTSHTNVSEQKTLDGWAREQLRTGKQPSEFWSFSASLRSAPWLRDYRVGDHVVVQVSDDPYIPDGSYTRRILELSGDETGQWVKITCGEVLGRI